MPSRKTINWATSSGFYGESKSTLFFIITTFLIWIAPCVHSKYFEESNSDEFFHGRRHHSIISGNWTEVGISPPVLNLATKAVVEVNATCGEREPENYCKLVEHAYSSNSGSRSGGGARSRSSQCQVCDAHSSDKGKRHPIRYTIDGSNRWWQSPSLQNGRQFEWVTITIDLKQIYQVAYIIIKAAISPRPGNWILERSLDGYVYLPWQYYAISDAECWSRYKIRAKAGKPSYNEDEEVICTSYYSQITPFEGGEIHTSLVNGRPGADGPSEALTRFTMARYVRLRLQKIRTLHGDLMNVGGPEGRSLDKSVLRRYFYSIKDISIGGHCVCFGHANECLMDNQSNSEKCMCQHNTCGDRCDICCPLFNQYPWGAGNSTASARCEPCQCYGHAESCVYDSIIHEQKKSRNGNGEWDGGGVCLDCKHNTTGINCEKCVDGYYRPKGVYVDDPNPCVKCDCDPDGSTGTCVGSEDEGRQWGKNAGDCFCKEGYEGPRCSKCAMGFKGFPRCITCPCHIPGITNMDCDGACLCKSSVEGLHCSVCKPGYFNLIKPNPEGCTQCFCHGVTSQCTSSSFPITQITDVENWFVTDLHGTKTVSGLQIGSTHQIANEEFASFNDYYWATNSPLFAGSHIDSYGLKLVFSVSWVRARGDTSGKPILDYDLILQSTNTMLGFSHKLHDGNNETMGVVLSEMNCVVLPDVDNHIIQGAKVSPVACTRYDIMEALSSVRKLLLRAKYHTDQIEGLLHFVHLEKADKNGIAEEGQELATSVEVCSCPEGYKGASCEECAYGFRKLRKETWLNECVRCDCNGHSESCDFEGNCLTCDHNATGDHCQFCKEGFYGDPTRIEGYSACKPCECPLRTSANNFSPTCKLVIGGGYECNACPLGYEGPYCERCANGYYGNPTQPGDSCKPCACASNIEGSGGDICDHLTGECLVCPRNTVGWNCDECAMGHYGNPLNGSCTPCGCSETGSLVAGTCHHDNGQCACKEGYSGRRCDSCLEGYGNVGESCPTCGCNPLGSISLKCDQITGQCPCKPGVGGRYCNKCVDNHFGFSSAGCTACGCNMIGCDASDLCDLNSGQCHCLPHVTGRKCDQCEPGWWNLRSGKGCQRCSCDGLGSFGESCDGDTGQCVCKPGVGGRRCDQCLEKHYGMTHLGCKVCDPCDKPGHICDPTTGRCVCPPNTEGDSCQKCTVGCWGYRPPQGCQPCNCSQLGSIQPQCTPDTGKCACANGFEGDKCNQCKFGYFNYPSCTPCNCDPIGTLESECGTNGTCGCSPTGQCVCKENVMGSKCDRCKPGHYGLELNNTEGCMECFCFQRTNKCSQGYFKWQRLGLLSSQNLMVVRTPGATTYLYVQFVGEDRCYVNVDSRHHNTTTMGALAIPINAQIPHQSNFCHVTSQVSVSLAVNSLKPFAMPSDRRVGITRRLENSLIGINNLLVVPDDAQDVIIEKDISFSHPLYWQLPHIFLGDKVLSYNGYLRFHTETIGGLPVFPSRVLASYPLIQIQGNHRLILEHFPEFPHTNGFYEVRLHEDDWRLKNGPYNGVVDKQVMMVALQNLQHILIRATHSPEVWNASLFNVSLDIAMPSPNGDKTMAHGIEVCDCPPQYNSTSCQNPRIGFYRWYKRDYITSTVIIDLVGEAKRCECNGRAHSCDTETGHCQNCADNTAGPRCDICAEGFYGNPSYRCLPCPCPSIWNNHAKTCYKHPYTSQYTCGCKTGYTGKGCDRCDYGYFGKPWERGGQCTPCRCNLYGSVSDECDEITGQCNCKFGVTGRDCSKCQERHVIIGKTCTSCDDQCTGVLLNDLDSMNSTLWGLKVDPESVLVWKKLAEMDRISKELTGKVNGANAVGLFLEDGPRYENLGNMMEFRGMEMVGQCEKRLEETYMLVEKGKVLEDGVRGMKSEAESIVRILRDYAEGRIIPGVNPEWAQKEAGDIVKEMEKQGEEIEGVSGEAEQELMEINKLYDVMLQKIFNETKTGEVFGKMKNIREKLEEMGGLIGGAEKATDDAERTMITAKEYLDMAKTNIDLVDEMTLNLDLEGVLTQTSLGEGEYLRTELEQVLLMLEDLVRDFRNTTKELEIRDNMLFDQIPLYRVLYAQPAFDHEAGLKMKRNYIEGLFGSKRLNGSEGIRGVTAFGRMKEGFDKAWELAKNASRVAEIGSIKINKILMDYPLTNILESSSRLLNEGLRISGIIENSLSGNFSKCRSSIEDAIKGGAPFDSVDAAISVSRAQHTIPQIQSGIRVGEQKQQRMSAKRESIEDRLKYLKALVKQSKHKANTVGVSIGPDDTGTCFRVYKWPSIDSATSILFNFAPTKTEDSLLLYWPSSITNDFIAIEMINLHIKASWDLGSGVRSMTQETKLNNLSLNSDDPDHWYQISFERVGSSAVLDVKPVSFDPSIPTHAVKSKPVKYANTDEEATLLNLAPGDLLHIGGMSRENRPGLVDNGLSGCLHNIQVNHQPLGLWNFARTEGCAACVECPNVQAELPSGDLEYYFDGRGYSVINRIQSQTFNSRFFDVSLEFRTFSENGLLFLTVNDTIGQIISLEMKEGRILMNVRHKWDDGKDSLRVETNENGLKYNTGEWILLRAVWVYQRGFQTAKLILGKKDYTQEKRGSGLSLKLYKANYQIGGVSPTFDPSKWDDVLNIVPYVGCMKNILVDGSTYDPMSGHYFGVESPCSGKSVYLTSFEGNGYAEFGSQPIGKNFKLGFSFKTVDPTGLMVLSTFARSLESPDEHYYAVFMEGGKVNVQIGVPQGPFDLVSGNGSRYDDGRFHSVRFFKKNRKMFLYLDDEELMELRLPKTTPTVSAPRDRGLFIGGTTGPIQQKFGETPLPIRTGFRGCIQNFYFENDSLNFNYPVSYSNQNLGQCPKHHDPDPLLFNTRYIFLNSMGGDEGRNEPVIRLTGDPECVPKDPVIEQEETFKAWHFGDAVESYATLNLVGSKVLKQTFNITFSFRTMYPNGMFFQGLRKRGGGGYCLMSFLKDGQVMVKLHGSRPQDLVSSVSGLNDGKWHQITVVKADDKMFLFVDGRNATQTQVPKIKAIAKIHIGGVPSSEGHDCLENSIHKPEYFKGCLKNWIINSHVYSLDSNSAHLSNVNPCFRSVEAGSFFRSGSFAIYSHNFTLGTMMEVQLDFRSDSRNGMLLNLVPNKGSRYPKFTIFLKDGKVVARETISVEEYYEAVADFEPDKGLVCDGHWHNVRANYEKGSITLRVDSREPIFALAEPESVRLGQSFPSSSEVGTIYIGGMDDGASRSNGKIQFHGCIRNIVLNRQIRDWTDMAVVHNVFLNACPL
ncbi:Laminin subunit alpha-1 [Orchesella cincta]|uniref:Laminin subunit alpha-1 n=1 Tax=Orchesella cincta TaxID=48709 RepID=A0A1D2MCH5_ORCCI|nr:Laminin subunit alpha-1 [Orchesella cincta]